MEPTSVVLADLQVVYYIKVAFLTLLVYDTLLQINEEYNHVWKSRWTLIKCLYLWTRYSTFVGASIPLVHAAYAGPVVCDGVTTFTTIFSTLGIGVTEMILMIRTYTLYERSKKLLAFFFALWFSLGGIAFWAVTTWSSRFSSSNSLPVESCYVTNSSGIGIGLVSYLVLLVGETTIVLLTLYKVFRKFSYREIGFLRSMYCDGVWFYLAILPFTIATVVCLFAAPFSGLNDTPVQVMHSILCCRLITHARNVAAEEDRREDAIKKVFKSQYMPLSNAVVDIGPPDKV
ncbi:hypothetical protein DFH08DRAFT_10532 [Mycena albidolilacea]|uniref:DUF6533 domain-containing protein n=1 Tax=Mycena albidolilacea TaxID=1033008 RepID=A0AAD7AU57_9AGAR|nr:hypothetical protein DFH08DRAFT_10532 [Mycena albidolilacea]